MPRISKKARLKALHDKSQMKLNPRSKAVIEKRDKGISTEYTFKQPTYFCPFCLYYGVIRDFETKTKRGNISKLYKCPDCSNGMRKKTLTTRMSTTEYAEWVFDYSHSGFFQKTPFKKWCSRMWRLGIATAFWKRYKELKGQPTDEEQMEADFDEQQRQWAEETFGMEKTREAYHYLHEQYKRDHRADEH